MACGCKKNDSEESTLSVVENDKIKKDGNIIINYVVRSFIFIVLLALSPLILLGVIGLLFKTIFLHENSVNLYPFLLQIGKKIVEIENSKKLEEEEYDDDEDLEIIDLEVIKDDK